MANRARQLRAGMTLSESRVWGWLRNRSFEGLKFRRQAAIGPYVVDFYCAELRLGLEIDGRHHQDPGMLEHDDDRTTYLSKRGIAIVRITNEMVARDPLTAGDVIRHAVSRRREELSGRPE